MNLRGGSSSSEFDLPRWEPNFVFPSPDVDEICFIYLPPHRVTFAPPPRFDKTLGLIRRGTEKRIELGDLDVECFHPSMRDDDVERLSITRATQKLFSKR